MPDMNEKIDLLHENVRDVKEILVGKSGDPKSGLVFRVVRLEDFTAGVRKVLWIIATTAMGVLVLQFLALMGVGRASP